MSEMSLIPGDYECGDRMEFQDFMDLGRGAIVWGKASEFEGPLQMDAVDGNFRSLTDGDKVAIGVEFPNVAPDSPVAAFTPVGQMEFFEAKPVMDGKD